MSLRRFARYALFLAPLLVVPLMVSASIDPNSTGLTEAGGAAGLSSICSSDASSCIANLVGRFLNMALGFIGLILFVYVVYGGVLYMTAAGDPKQVQKAKDTLQNAVIGVFLIVLAFSISSFVLDRAIEVTGGTQIGGGGGGGGEVGGTPGSSTSLTGGTGGALCRCTCTTGGADLALRVVACGASTCSVSICDASCRDHTLGGSTVAPTCAASSGTAPTSPDAGVRATLMSGGDSGLAADACIAAMRARCAPSCPADQSLQACFTASPLGLTTSVTTCLSATGGVPPCDSTRIAGALLLGY